MGFMPQNFGQAVSKVVQWISIFLLLGFLCAVFTGSFLRYGFDAGFVKLEDLIGFAFAALIVLSILVAFINNAHVRVNIFSSFKRLQQNPLGRVIFALSFLGIAFLCIPAIKFSWSTFEASAQHGGLGGLFFVKTLLPISFVMIAIFLVFSREDNSK
jgi:TRAP-type mannitol/chloroaromatic compound transport system permease small subunit